MAASPPHPSKKLKIMSSSSSPATSDAEGNAGAHISGDQPPQRPPRYKRRKVAIFLAYCGAGYQGMQKNPGARTIEGDLEEALFLAGAVPPADRGIPRRYDWARSARTDKGVSAASQVVSGRFYVDQPPGIVAGLNAHLPDQIRVFGYRRVTNSFNAKKFCDRRRYVYLLPVFAFDPNAHPHREAVMASVGSGNELARCVECSERGRKVPGLMGRRSGEQDKGEKSDLAVELVEKGANSSNGLEAENDGSEVVNSHLESNNEQMPSSAGDETVREQASDCKLSEEVGKEASETEVVAMENDDSAVKNNVVSVEENAAAVEVAASLEDQRQEHGIPEPSNSEEQVVSISDFCYGEKEKERFNKILNYYVGTHNFHNFTTRTKAEDPAARRYIISFSADHVVNIGGIDFVRCEVLGQSFMLHQIRKMIGLAVSVMRNCAPESLMDVALQKDVNINVPTAPEVGLYLDECLFTSYNQKWKDSHEPLTMETYAEESEEFKMKYIFSHIASMEHKEGAVALWLHSLNHRNYPDFGFMESNGLNPRNKDPEQGSAE